jgi:NADH dehydrogenase/NADH:ubiquinone oxidoreductase subunit G
VKNMKNISLQINGKNVIAEEGMTIIQAAEKAGINIPNLCHDERLKPFGACRFCMVEIEKNNRKKLVASCCYPAEEGLIVNTKTKDVEKIRRILAELVLSLTPSGTHVEIANQLGIKESRFKQLENPETPCNFCGLCVRYCKEIKKNNAVCFVGRGVNRTVTLVPGASDKCLACRECFDVCDAGKIVYLVDMIQEISCPPLKSSFKRSD